MRVFLFCIFSILQLSAVATTSIDKPVKTMAFLNGSLMASPIMPIQFNPKAGENTFSIRPTVFQADSGLQEHDGARWKAKFSGKGAAGMYHWQISSDFGVYGLAMYNQIDEGEFIGRGSDPSDEDQDVYSLDVTANFMQTSFGFTYNLINSSWFGLQLLAGPTLTVAEATQRVYQAHPADPDDFMMTINPSVVGALAGVQLGIKLFDYFAINPYFMMSAPLNETCVEYTSKVTQSGDLVGISDPACNSSSGNPQLEYDTSFTTVGVNILVPAWGLSFNVMTELEQIQGIEGTEPELYYFTLTLF